MTERNHSGMLIGRTVAVMYFLARKIVLARVLCGYPHTKTRDYTRLTQKSCGNLCNLVFLPQVIEHVRKITAEGAEERRDSPSASLCVSLRLNALFGYSTPNVPGSYDKTISQAHCRCNKDPAGDIQGRTAYRNVQTIVWYRSIAECLAA